MKHLHEALLQMVAETTRVDAADIMGKGRKAHVIHARQLLRWCLVNLAKVSREQVAQLQHVEWATVRWSCEQIDHAIITDPETAEQVTALRAAWFRVGQQHAAASYWTREIAELVTKMAAGHIRSLHVQRSASGKVKFRMTPV